METISIVDVATLAVVGAFVSAVVQFLKSTFGASALKLRLSVIGLSLALGAGYWFLRDTAFLTAFLGIVLFANTAYTFLMKPLEDAGEIQGR